MRKGGLESPRIAPLDPKSEIASSTHFAKGRDMHVNARDCKSQAFNDYRNDYHPNSADWSSSVSYLARLTSSVPTESHAAKSTRANAFAGMRTHAGVTTNDQTSKRAVHAVNPANGSIETTR
jgi:hypothetical protein